MVSPPPVLFPEPVRDDLNAHRPGLAEETERLFSSHVRPCVAVTLRRVSQQSLRRGALARLFGARQSAPVLGPLEYAHRLAVFRGEARYYFGLPVANGSVRWRVLREPVMPWWPRSGGLQAQHSDDIQQVVAAGSAALKELTGVAGQSESA